MSVERSELNVERSAPKGAVFLSYASQDAEAAKRICDALRQAGVEVWFDQSELVGGDAWDAKIRRQIRDCALLIPVISANTQARTEGYFRLEWRLADQRTHLMAKGRPFLLPVVIDDIRDAEAHVPDSFTEVQWTRLPGGEASAAFAAQVKKMVGGELRQITGLTHSREDAALPLRAKVGRRVPVTAWVGLATVLGLGIAGWVGLRPTSRTDVSISPPAQPAAPLSESQQLLAKIAAIVEKDADAGREDWLLAENLGAQVVKLEPANAEAWAAYSRAALGHYLTGGDLAPDTSLTAALQRAQQGVALRPESREAKLALALAYTMDSKTRAEAEPILRALLEQHPDDRRLWRARGTLAQLQKRYDEALTFYDRADALPGGDPVSCRLKGALLSGLGRYDEAERSIERSLELRPGPATHLMKLIFLATVRDDLPQACALLERLPGSYFLRDDTTYCAVQLWMWNREPAKAVRLLAGWRDNYIGNSPKGIALGQAYQLMGRAEAAQQAWRSALALAEKQLADVVADSDPLKYYAKARLLAHLGEKAGAEEAARLWEQSDPDKVGGQNKAVLLVLMGRNEEAVAALPKQPWNGLSPVVGTLGRLALGGASYRYDPIWDPLRGDPRFEELAARFRTMWGHAPGSKVAASDSKSVAVLAFANLSDDKANEYFSDGISEELINVLGRVPGLTVKGRASSFYFKGSMATAQEKGLKLGATFLVDGSVRKAGNSVRITAQLSRAATDEILWSSEPLVRDLKDVWAVQEEIAALIAKNLSLKLGTSSAAATALINPQAFEFYFRAREAWKLRTLADYDRAEELLTRALALAPNFARAHAALADVWFTRAQDLETIGGFARRNSPEQHRIVAKITQALALDPELAEAHASLGGVASITWQMVEGERELRRAIALNPNYATAHQWLGRLMQDDGRMDEALAELKLATEIEPFAPRILDNYGKGLYLAGRYAEAIAVYDRTLAIQPNALQTLSNKAQALAAGGRLADAVELARTLPVDGTNPGARRTRIIVFARNGLKAEAESLLTGFDQRHLRFKPACLLALGRTEEALALLTPATLVSNDLSNVLFEPLYDSIRTDPGIVKLFAELGVTEAHARAQAWRKAHPPEKQAK